ncbi:MAG: hypothetical protein ACOZDY_18545 [Pseudomonadota bacterium]
MSDNEQQQSSEPGTAEAARTQLVALRENAEFMDRYVSGDARAVSEMTRAFAAAYPERQGTGDAQPPERLPEGAEWLARPATPAGYDFSALRSGPEPSPQERELSAEIAQALHAEGVPAAVVDVAVQVMARNVRQGLPDDEALEHARLAAQAELELRHGDQAGAILASARKLYERLEQRDPRIAELIDLTGAGNSAWLIESMSRAWDQKFSKAR